MTSQQMIVIDSETQFGAYWAQSTGSPASTAPSQNVDWIKQRLVAIHLGARSTTGYNVVVQNIVRGIGTLTIKAVEETPIPNQYVAKVITSPWVIIQVDRDASQFQIEWSSRRANPSIILGPGGVYIGPRDQTGAGWEPVANQCNWGTFRAGTECNITSQQVIVMSSEWDFANYYRRAFDGPVPNSGNDWLQFKLVAVHLGSKPTTGYGISVRNVLRSNGGGIIRAAEEAPLPGQIVTRIQTQPWVIVRVECSLTDFKLDLQPDETNRRIVITGGGSGGG